MVLHHPHWPWDKSKNKVFSEIAARLQDVPWCITILNNPDIIPITTNSRRPVAPRYGDSYTFLGETLATPSTVPIFQPFYRPSKSSDASDLGEVFVIAELGSGMNGHLHTAHGGLAAVLLDEVMGLAASIHKTPKKSIFTAYMHVNYRKPLPTPNMICLRSRIEKRSEGRKIFVRGSVEDGSTGVVFVDSDALFLEVERMPRGVEWKL